MHNRVPASNWLDREIAIATASLRAEGESVGKIRIPAPAPRGRAARAAARAEKARANRLARRRFAVIEPYASLSHPAGPCLMGCGLCAAY
jgi:hypothetical protein